jgi:hypothetical protein
VVLLVYAAAVLTAISVGWARRGPAAQAAVIALIGGCGVALAVLQPHGPVEIAASLGVWIAAVRPRRRWRAGSATRRRTGAPAVLLRTAAGCRSGGRGLAGGGAVAVAPAADLGDLGCGPCSEPGSPRVENV